MFLNLFWPMLVCLRTVNQSIWLLQSTHLKTYIKFGKDLLFFTSRLNSSLIRLAQFSISNHLLFLYNESRNWQEKLCGMSHGLNMHSIVNEDTNLAPMIGIYGINTWIMSDIKTETAAAQNIKLEQNHTLPMTLCPIFQIDLLSTI